MITIFYIIETILIYFYSLGFSLNARPHKRQRFNHHRVEIKVVVAVVEGTMNIQRQVCIIMNSTINWLLFNSRYMSRFIFFSQQNIYTPDLESYYTK